MKCYYTNISVDGSCWVKQMVSVGFGCQPRVTTRSVTESQYNLALKFALESP